MLPFKIPDYREIDYVLNIQSGYYEKQPSRIAFTKMPFELKIEETQDERIKLNGAKEIIRGRIKDGKYLFFTGLIETDNKYLFRGDHYEFTKGKKKNSLVLFLFSKDNSKLKVIFFNGFSVYPSKMRSFIIEFIKKWRNSSAPPLTQNSRSIN